jgi:AraC family transcriptional regulator, regulatory protein of adaptative response / DNA-3-methyladenine glycosylase II
MGLSRKTMLEAMEARDSAYDGRFITGVLSTGIYCLPSCKARNPKSENVRFFVGPEEAQRAGLRACKRCRPDDFYAGRDEDELLVEGLLGEIDRDPSRFAGVEDLARASGLGSSKLHELFRKYLHTTPVWRLQEARIEAARRLLLETDSPVSQIAFDVGYESLSAFNEGFRRRNGMTALGYRGLLGATELELRLPPAFPVARMLGYLARDAESLTVRAAGATGFREGARFEGEPVLVEVQLSAGRARCSLEPTLRGGSRGLDPRAAAAAHGWLLRRLGLVADVAGFQRLAEKLPEMAPLLRVERGLRIPQTGTPFEALIWAIVGQQVNLPFAYRLLNRVVEKAGTPVADGLFAPPLPEAVAALVPGALRQVQFSRSKAEYLVGAAGRVAEGLPDLDRMARGSAVRAERELREIRGVGAWTARYVLMRGFGFADCVPVGDAGLVRGLMALYGLEARPGPQETEDAMARFRPYRSLATFHLWQTLEEAT